ncbi:hypothetical protein TKK_0010764 [Trichogramma kaykai]|uniref:Osiris 16 n=1 Tax=Trichogramma kaykai TaxID=54128 RepID=A0ABD2WW87_9HYME
MDSWKKDCVKTYTSTCLKLDIVSFVDRLSEQENLGILPGVSVIKQNSSGAASNDAPDVVANLARDFPKDVDKRMDAYLMHKIGTYLNNHAISIKLFDPRTFEATKKFNDAAMQQLDFGEKKSHDVESGRKKDKGYGSMMAGLMMMKGTLGALGFGALAMLAGKALMTGLMALMLSAIVGLKHLSSGGDHKTTYEIVSKPVYATTHSHSSEEHHAYPGYARNLETAPEVHTQQQMEKNHRYEAQKQREQQQQQLHHSQEETIVTYGNVRERRQARYV